MTLNREIMDASLKEARRGAALSPRAESRRREHGEWQRALLQHSRDKEYLRRNYSPELEAELLAEFNKENLPALQRVCDWHNSGRKKYEGFEDYDAFLTEFNVQPQDFAGELTPGLMILSRDGRRPGGQIKGINGEEWRELFHSS